MARPTEEAKTIRLDLRFPPSLIEPIDEWRRKQPDIPPRAEAIRRLIDLGLEFSAWHKFACSIFDAFELKMEDASSYNDAYGDASLYVLKDKNVDLEGVILRAWQTLFDESKDIL